MPFRSQPPPPALPQGYWLEAEGWPVAEELNGLLMACGEPRRPPERIERALARSAWQLSIRTAEGVLVAFVRATSDQALNANLWDLVALPTEPESGQLLLVLVHAALARLRRELPGCSISVAATPESLQALRQHGFVVDPGGIRAMGLVL
ncbi:MAG: N-acetyltransferase [Synechococcaceae bacterium WB8_1B_136]|nr:N-acetyltransferase [Synechococcaceae bacterium WB8_1B_136]